jgi:glycosyltransferase involved in cell wall biosynthesis
VAPRQKLLIVSAGLRIGGVERGLLGLLDALGPDKYDITLFLNSHDGELMALLPRWVQLLEPIPAYAELDRPIRKVLLSSPRIAFARLCSKLITSLKRLAGTEGDLLARSVRYSVPFLPAVPGEYDYALGFLTPHDVVLRKVSARRKFGWIHTDYTHEPCDVRFERPTWLALDMLVAVTDGAARAFESRFGLRPGLVRTVQNITPISFIRAQSIAFDAKSQMPAKPNEIRLFSAGRLAIAKGFDIAVEAARLLAVRGVPFRWYVSGSGIEEPRLRQMIAQYGLEDRFILLGSTNNPYPNMAACDIYIQPSRYEGFGIAVREAQILGKPAVITDYNIAREQIRDGVDGLIAPMTPTGLADTIARLAADSSLRDKLSIGTRGRDYGNLSEVERLVTLLTVVI